MKKDSSSTAQPNPVDAVMRMAAHMSGVDFAEARTKRLNLHHLDSRRGGRVVAKLMHSLAATMGNKVGKEAEELCASGQCAWLQQQQPHTVFDSGHRPQLAVRGENVKSSDFCLEFNIIDDLVLKARIRTSGPTKLKNCSGRTSKLEFALQSPNPPSPPLSSASAQRPTKTRSCSA